MSAARGAVSARVLLAVMLGMSASACRDPTDSGRFYGTPTPRDRLLTDAELRTSEDPNAPVEDSAHAAWIARNHFVIRSLTSKDYSDLQFLKPLLAGKRVVQLGESGHGVAEFDLVKVRLVKFLHAEMGFDVIAFESGLFECHGADATAGDEEPRETMRRCIYRIWRVEEVEPLFTYLRMTQRTARPLHLAGFDPQISSPSTAHFTTRPALLAEAIGAVDPLYAARVRTLDSAYLSRHDIGGGDFERWRAYIRDSAAVLQPAYDSAAAFLDANRAAVALAFPTDPGRPRLARQVAWSAARFTEQLKLSLVEGIGLRDRTMAANVEFLLDELYPDRRIIVWAHNAHVRHAIPGNTPPGITAAMGQLLADRRRADLYTVGLYMYRGQAADNGENTYDVTPHGAGSMESILHRARTRYLWVDLSRQQPERGNSWMFASTMAKEWGTRPTPMVPRDHYDAILFIDSTRAPRYIRTP